MDVLYRHAGLEFVWNLHKAAANIEKHGIRFEQACEVFLDPLAHMLDAGNGEEVRTALVGETEDRNLVFVVHMEREDDIIRLISARPASAAERRSYEDNA